MTSVDLGSVAPEVSSNQAGLGSADIGGWARERLGITLETVHSPVGLTLEDLVGVAIRQNPKRAHLLVSTVLGKHIPVDPRIVHGTGLLLGALISRVLDGQESVPTEWSQAAAATLGDEPGALVELFASIPAPRQDVLVLGFAETATGLGHSAAVALGATCYLHSTRRVVPGIPATGTFEEGHSHASTHLLAPVPTSILSRDLPLVMVDDEFSTGRTLMATITELQAQFPRRRYIVAALIDLRSAEAIAELDSFAEQLGIRVDVVSLVAGRVYLPADILTDAAALMASLPPAQEPLQRNALPVVRVEIPWQSDVPDGGRHGFLAGDRVPFDQGVQLAASLLAAELAPYRRVLLLGTEEFMYLPHLVGAALAGAGEFEVRYQTTTRSPVFPVDEPSYPVRRRLSFVDPEGDTVAGRFLNNAQWIDSSADATHAGSGAFEADAIVIMVDQPADSALLYGDLGLVTTVASLGVPVIVAALQGADPERLAAARARTQSDDESNSTE